MFLAINRVGAATADKKQLPEWRVFRGVVLHGDAMPLAGSVHSPRSQVAPRGIKTPLENERAAPTHLDNDAIDRKRTSNIDSRYPESRLKTYSYRHESTPYLALATMRLPNHPFTSHVR